MRIAIDARYVADHFPGIGRYVYNLLGALAGLDHGHTLVVLHNPALPNTRHDLATLAGCPAVELVAVDARPFTLAEQLALPRLLRRLRADLYHAPYYVRPYAGLPCPSVVTLYDVIPHRFPGEVSRHARLLFDLLTRLAIRASRRVIAISQSARADLAATYGIPTASIDVTPLAADARFRPQPPAAVAAVRAKYGLPADYVLSLASNKPHKNLVRLIEAWAQVMDRPPTTDHRPPTTDHRPPTAIQNPSDPHPATAIQNPKSKIQNPKSKIPATCDELKTQNSKLKTQLVIAGHWDPRYAEARRLVAERRLEGVTRFLPDVAEADLPGLYGGAAVFAFPSLYEGFGLPPLEALACGTAVLCANTSSLPEVVGDAALLVDPSSVVGIAAGLERLLDDDALRAALRAAGPRRAATFSWRATAEATLAVYERAYRGLPYSGEQKS